MRFKLLGAALGLSLAFSTTTGAFAQTTGPDEGTGEEMGEEQVADETSTSSPFSTTAAGTFGQPGDAGPNTGLGHASDTSNNWLGDVAEGLSNQYPTSDENTANSSSGVENTTNDSDITAGGNDGGDDGGSDGGDDSGEGGEGQ